MAGAKDSIANLASSVQDNGRRGEPKPGCDCMRCFGYCVINEDQALRDRALANDHRPAVGLELFDDVP